MKGVSFNYSKTVSKDINLGVEMFPLSKNQPTQVSEVATLHNLG